MMLDKEYNKKKTPFRVPENYFDNLQRNIMAKIDELPLEKQLVEKKPQKISIWKHVAPWAAIAAVLVSVVLVVQPWNEKRIADQLDETDDIETYYSFLENEVLATSYDEYIYDELDF